MLGVEQLGSSEVMGWDINYILLVSFRALLTVSMTDKAYISTAD